jgi:hypothetical protein
MAYQPRNVVLPPNRKWWDKAKTPARRMTDMLLDELAYLLPLREKTEAESIRGFISRYRLVTREGSCVKLELTVRKAPKFNTLVIYGHIPDMGAANWFPALVIPSSNRIERVMVECGVLERHPLKLEPKRDAWGEVEQRRPPVIEKVAIQMVGG